ncbi:NADH-quinone oxidoreductase subunit L [Roseimaritima multifibrata]|uniref:Probable inorganic carbon transporter subunit DabB n=2 Tax=Roseimaritima multifibrata TaxID=1930274 RepID=A0A517M9K6_9BACT|nr:NADH-quinone oxidoreductase subunit L [Roseimaritima multifibrata]
MRESIRENIFVLQTGDLLAFSTLSPFGAQESGPKARKAIGDTFVVHYISCVTNRETRVALMPAFIAVPIVLPALALLALGLIPSRIANQRAGLFRQAVTGLVACQLVIVTLMAVFIASGISPTIAVEFKPLPTLFGIYYDGVAALMLAMVSAVGWVICRFSIRYLDGESGQGRYFRWTGFTIGAVSLLVVSGNLLMFFGCWVTTSLGLHQLLMHYGHRSAARRAAWTKFAISRLGDVALMGAIALIYSQFKTLNFSELFTLSKSVGDASPAMIWAGSLLVLGAITKSAQFPFHTWLPQTMETPTPVSALMHAGIVNAGGYLIIRTSPLLQMAPLALTGLAVVGAITACLGAVVMLTQTSVKKQLAYSTIAQMGFMMLQCGLGAFSAAMLHILAHSLYKAHAFLNSGNVMAQRTSTLATSSESQPVPWPKLAFASLAIVACFALAMATVGIDIAAKPGGLVLGAILCLALTHWVSQAIRISTDRMLIRVIATAAMICFVYAIGFLAVDKTIAASLPEGSVPTMAWLSGSIIAAGFAGMFLLQMRLSSRQTSPLLNRFYVHATNGFYLEKWEQRVFAPLAKN